MLTESSVPAIAVSSRPSRPAGWLRSRGTALQAAPVYLLAFGRERSAEHFSSVAFPVLMSMSNKVLSVVSSRPSRPGGRLRSRGTALQSALVYLLAFGRERSAEHFSSVAFPVLMSMSNKVLSVVSSRPSRPGGRLRSRGTALQSALVYLLAFGRERGAEHFSRVAFPVLGIC